MTNHCTESTQITMNTTYENTEQKKLQEQIETIKNRTKQLIKHHNSKPLFSLIMNQRQWTSRDGKKVKREKF